MKKIKSRILIDNIRVIQAKNKEGIREMGKFDSEKFRKIPFMVLMKFDTEDSFLKNSEAICVNNQWYAKADEKQKHTYDAYLKDPRDLQGYEQEEVFPGEIVFKRKDDDEKSFWLEVELYGIKFEVKEGSSKGFAPLAEIAKSLSISIEEMCDKLKKKNLLDRNGKISEAECLFDGCGKSNEGTINYASIVFQHIFNFPENCPDDLSKVKRENLIDKGIYGHVGFITELIGIC